MFLLSISNIQWACFGAGIPNKFFLCYLFLTSDGLIFSYYDDIFHVTITITVTNNSLLVFTPCQSFNRRSPFNRLWNEPKAFLVAVPDSNAFAVVPALLGLHVRCLLLLLPLLFFFIFFIFFSTRTIHSSKENVGEGIRTLDPWSDKLLLWPNKLSECQNIENWDGVWFSKFGFRASTVQWFIFVYTIK